MRFGAAVWSPTAARQVLRTPDPRLQVAPEGIMDGQNRPVRWVGTRAGAMTYACLGPWGLRCLGRHL